MPSARTGAGASRCASPAAHSRAAAADGRQRGEKVFIGVALSSRKTQEQTADRARQTRVAGRGHPAPAEPDDLHRSTNEHGWDRSANISSTSYTSHSQHRQFESNFFSNIHLRIQAWRETGPRGSRRARVPLIV